MTFLLDTNILSEPTKRFPDARAMKWLASNEGEWGISSVALAEVRFGILMLPRRPTPHAAGNMVRRSG